VARLSGINTDRVRMGCLMAPGFLGALAGMLYSGTQGAADPVSGVSYQLLPLPRPSLARPVSSRVGSTPGVRLLRYFLVTTITGLVFLRVSSFIQEMFCGGVLVIAVTLSRSCADGRSSNFDHTNIPDPSLWRHRWHNRSYAI
jgi:ribose transport system permease protein